jgi:three-Cys-motif partner protein
MKMSRKEEVINKIGAHTVKKFELIQKYVEAWAQKLLNNQFCDALVFIDCMSNSGEYINKDGKHIFGTPVRVAQYLRNVAGQYPNKQIDLYFSDLSPEKTAHLSRLMPKNKQNFHIHISTEDGNDLAKRIGRNIEKNKHYLLVYDPYDASIDWDSLIPFINNWSEIILNHVVSDSMRAIKMVKNEKARNKYENTYLTKLDNLIPYGSNKIAYEERIEAIIQMLRQNKDRDFYIAAFPFFNEKNAIVYNLIHCTSNIKGFRLYKQSAWQTFGGKSSTKDTHGEENQLMFDLIGDGAHSTKTDEFCYYIKDVADYLQRYFDGKSNVPLAELWKVLDEHPVFPSDGFKQQIKNELKQTYDAKESHSTISFARRR